jgi:hypothetical protein
MVVRLWTIRWWSRSATVTTALAKAKSLARERAGKTLGALRVTRPVVTLGERAGGRSVRCLGRDSLFEPEHDGGENDAPAVDRGVLVVAGRQAAPVLDPVEGSLDDVAILVGVDVKVDGPTAG